MQFALSTAFLALSGLVGLVVSEIHTVRFDNRCGTGTTPALIVDGREVSGGGSYTSGGPIVDAVAYLQTGYCWFAGNNCTVIETTLQNDDPGSETVIHIKSPYSFSVPTSFRYSNGCEGTGTYICNDEDCVDNNRVVRCTDENVNLDITFCT